MGRNDEDRERGYGDTAPGGTGPGTIEIKEEREG